MIPVKIAPQWHQQLTSFFISEKWQTLQHFLEEEQLGYTVYPKTTEFFRALELTDYTQVRVVILGQDPYHGENQANGLSFSVPNGQKLPPSLRNIFQELKNDLQIERYDSDLSDWAKQGVLLLNTVLSVRAHQANSHQGRGWETLTELILTKLSAAQQPIVFVLWGKQAQKYKKLLTNPNHFIIESPHPSPLSVYRGFFGSKPFSQINTYLVAQQLPEIHW
ncbi:MAG: uracil-DNA glycosylase [Culicoidibacterales bacterium]